MSDYKEVIVNWTTNAIDTDKCYISGCQCGKQKYERQTDDDR